MGRKRVVIIPSYEPDENFVNLVSGISKSKNYDIIVIDDGSGVSYKDIFKRVSKYCKLIQYDVNRGKGYALKTAFQYVKEKYVNNYIVVTMDSDGQHSFNDAIKLCDYIEENPLSLVLGMRKRTGNTPLRSRIGNEITMGVYEYATGVCIYDTQTGLRAFSNEIMNFMLSVSGDRFEYEMNVLLMAVRDNIKIKEIEIQTVYFNNNSGSHFNAFADSIKIYREILKFSLSSIISFVIDYFLYTLLFLLVSNVTISNIFARIISGCFNYNINRKIVFKSSRRKYRSFGYYAILAVSILAVNTVLLNIFVCCFGMNAFFSKVLVELLLFVVSFIVQKRLVFKN